MLFPLTFWNFGLWLAVVAILLLATAEIVSSHYGEATLFIKKNRLRNAALIVGLLSMLIIAMRIYQIITLP